MRDAKARAALAAWQRAMAPHIYQHAVVAGELLLGAKDTETWDRWYARWVLPAERVRRFIAPERGVWLRASRIIARLRERGRLTSTDVKPSFFNDCLLAASAHTHGFVLITHNAADFEKIRDVEPAARTLPPFP